MPHLYNGNCWDSSIIYDCDKGCLADAVCDVCHQHDEPRDDCNGCDRCPECDKDAA